MSIFISVYIVLSAKLTQSLSPPQEILGNANHLQERILEALKATRINGYI